MASQQQSRIKCYMEKNRIGPLFEDMMTRLITETPDHPVPFLIGHLQSKVGSPAPLQRTLSGSAALWADTDTPEHRGSRRSEKPWQIHPKKPKKSKSDLAVSNISPPSSESKSLPRPSWDWGSRSESHDFDELSHILQESKKLGKALENLSRSIAVSDEFDQELHLCNSSVPRPRVLGQWVGRVEDDADPLAAEMLQAPVPRAKKATWESEAASSPAASLKMEIKRKGLKQHQQHHKKLLAAMLCHASTPSPAPSAAEEEIEDEDDAMELLEDLDDLRMEGVTGVLSSGWKFSQGRGSYCPEPQAKVTLNICSRCARLQGDSLTDIGGEEELRSKFTKQAVPELPAAPWPGAETLAGSVVECESGSQRHPVWVSDLRASRGGCGGGGGALGWHGLQLKDSLLSKELEDVGKHLAEVEKDLAKLAEGKLPRSPNALHGAPPLLNTKPTSLLMGRPPPASSPSSRSQTPRTPNTLTPGSHSAKEFVFGSPRSRPVTPTRPLLTPPGLSSTEAHGRLSEADFYQQLQALRRPWLLPSDTDSDCMDPPQQDKCL
ncbi:uncharacterized protein C8orf34 homolog isoform X2 [Denticeps clupeoides]|uniref:uncharacterized protein C8orf34 homolog isoform X2 n=1 Tax=Denticeps clupeoides TaxID=299321 RepID=UPI0010A3BC6D|nr:uncharacterized protein C8orf34 homolog isoform X2 [Denticeps clupeoides]